MAKDIQTEHIQEKEIQTEEPQTMDPAAQNDQAAQAPEQAAPEAPKQEAPKEERTFSQSEVNRIVHKRLAEERSKAETLFAQRERALAHKELRLEATDELRQRKLPVSLAELLDYEDRERCAASLDAMEAGFQAAVREGIHRALRGLEPPKDGAGRRDPGAAVRGAMGLCR